MQEETKNKEVIEQKMETEATKECRGMDVALETKGSEEEWTLHVKLKVQNDCGRVLREIKICFKVDVYKKGKIYIWHQRDIRDDALWTVAMNSENEALSSYVVGT